MVKLGLLNSRMKGFYNIWALSQQFDFDGATLAVAVRTTFENRGTMLPSEPEALSASFASDATKSNHWRALRRKTRLDHAPEEFAAVTQRVTAFLMPLLVASRSRNGSGKSGRPLDRSGGHIRKSTRSLGCPARTPARFGRCRSGY